MKGVEGLGDISAQAIVDFFDKYKDNIKNLLVHLEPQGKVMGKLSGQTFVFTGGFDGGKSAWEAKVLALGGTVAGNVSKNTSYVVIGVDAGSKEEKAKTLGVKMLTPSQLENLL